MLPSISFVRDIGPVVITCYDNNCGTEQFKINPCFWKYNLLLRRPDQICQSVIQPCILKPIKYSKYPTSYCIFYQYEKLNGIDTCSASSYGNFDSTSNLLEEYEYRSMLNRPNINAHLKELCRKSIIF